MADKIYKALRQFLDQFPFGYPETKSGVEIEILKRLFSEDEAELALKLTVFPEDADSIAKRTGIPSDELDKRLEEMAQKGLVFRISRHEKKQYNAIPFVVGLYEYAVKKMDSRLAKLCKEYVDTVYMDEIGATNIPALKVVPIEKRIGAETELLPYNNIVESVRKAKKIAVAECICRKEKRLLGEGCTHPLESCLTFGITAEYYIESGLGREINVDEAIQIIEEADKSGLVHTGTNTKSMSIICNCCPCCCPFMKAITKSGYDRARFYNSNFEAVVDAGECVACGTCVDRCPVSAISVSELAEVDRNKCLGCGLCATECQTNAITLILREDREEPFDKLTDMGLSVLEAKSKLP
jgi:electron transport complex protein RnfB